MKSIYIPILIVLLYGTVDAVLLNHDAKLRMKQAHKAALKEYYNGGRFLEGRF